jgi:hypothetical protein
MKAMTTCAFAILLLPIASRGGADCPPLKVTADDKDVALVAGFAKRFPAPDGDGFMVSMYDHGEMTCPDYVKATRPVKEGELEVRAYITKDAAAVGVNYATIVAKVFPVDEARGAGQKASICIPEPVEYEGQAYGGKKVVIQGLLAGNLCEPR